MMTYPGDHVWSPVVGIGCIHSYPFAAYVSRIAWRHGRHAAPNELCSLTAYSGTYLHLFELWDVVIFMDLKHETKRSWIPLCWDCSGHLCGEHVSLQAGFSTCFLLKSLVNENKPLIKRHGGSKEETWTCKCSTSNIQYSSTLFSWRTYHCLFKDGLCPVSFPLSKL